MQLVVQPGVLLFKGMHLMRHGIHGAAVSQTTRGTHVGAAVGEHVAEARGGSGRASLCAVHKQRGGQGTHHGELCFPRKAILSSAVRVTTHHEGRDFVDRAEAWGGGYAHGRNDASGRRPVTARGVVMERLEPDEKCTH